MDFLSNPLLSLVDDVSEGTPLASAEQTLGRLGFVSMNPVDVVIGGSHQTWVHPEGLILFASMTSSPAPQIASVRLGAVVNFGWQPLHSLSNLPSGGTWLAVNGQSLLQVNASLFGGATDQDRTIKGVLRLLGKQGGRLEPFERWQQEAQANSTQSWLFVVGNETLTSIGNEVGIAQWLSNAPDPLRAFVQERYDRLCIGSTAYQPNPYESQKHLTAHLQKAVHARGLSLSTEEAARVQQWVESTQPSKPFEKDMTIHPSGVSQATLLALRGGNSAGKWQHKRLLSWLKTAPKQTLEHVCGTADGAGHTVLSLLVASVADARHRDAKAGNDAIHEAFAVVAKRLGTDTLDRFLNEEGNGLGWVFGTMACRNPAPTDWREMARLLSTWETLGVHVPTSAALRSCHQAQLGAHVPTTLDTPEEQVAFVKRQVRLPSPDSMDLASLTAFLKERHLQHALARQAPSQDRPRLRL